MKKNTIKITIFLMSLVLIFTMFYSKPIKAASTTLSASSATVESGESFSVTVSSSLSLSAWTINLTNNGGCTFTSASGGEVTGTSVYGTSLNGTKTLATYKFKAPSVTKDTKYTISFSGTNMGDSTDEVNIVDDASCSATITVKAKNTSSSSGSSSSGSGNSGSSSSSSSTTKKPTFKSVNETVYTKQECNLRSTWSTGSGSSATLVPAGTKLTLTGTSSETINDYTWYRVTYNGTTKYIASYLITYDKPEEEKLFWGCLFHYVHSS